MPKYIDAEKIEYKSILYPIVDGISVKTRKIDNVVEKQDIDNMPTADVHEVKHGTWQHTDDGAARCTSCKRKMNPYVYGYAYCPLCGARMDGGGK